MNNYRDNFGIQLFGTIVSIIFLWFLQLAFFWCLGISGETLGSFGDFFGAFNSLFSGLAFAVVIFSLIYQRRDLLHQFEEFEKLIEAQEKSSESLLIQLDQNLDLAKKKVAHDLVDQWFGPLTRARVHCESMFDGDPHLDRRTFLKLSRKYNTEIEKASAPTEIYGFFLKCAHLIETGQVDADLLRKLLRDEFWWWWVQLLHPNQQHANTLGMQLIDKNLTQPISKLGKTEN